MPTVHTAPVIGLPRLDGWSQVTTNTHGTLVCAFAISGSNANNLGRDVAEQLLTFEPATSAQIHQQLLDILQRVRETESVLHFAGYLHTETQVTLLTYNGAILLQRKSKVGRVITSRNELKLVEGQYVPGDLIVLTTDQVATFLDEITQKLTRQFEVDSIITSILPALHGQEDSSLSAIAFVTTTQPIHAEDHKVHALLDAEQYSQSTAQSQESGTEDSYSESEYLHDNTENDISHYNTSIEPNKTQDTHAQTAVPSARSNQVLRSSLAVIKKVLSVSWRGVRTFARILPAIGGSRSVYIASHKQHSVARLVLLVVAIISCIVGLVVWQQKTKSTQLDSAAAAAAPALVRLEGAKTLAQSNDLIAARKETQQAITELSSLAAAFEKKEYALEYFDQKKTVAESFLNEISAQEKVSNLDLFFDLRLTNENFVASQVALSGNTALFLDIGKRAVVSLDLEKKSSKTMPLTNSNSLRALGVDAKAAYLLGDGIVRISLADDKTTTLKTAGDSDGGGTILATFSTYIYVVNPEKRNIYRYIVKDDGLSEPIGWLVDKTGIDFENIRSMAIDGDVWLGSTDGKIFRYTQGNPSEFNIQGLSQPFSGPLYLYTHEELDTLFILEPDKKRLVLLKKNGELEREISSESLAATNGIIVSKTLNAAFVVSGSILYRIAL